MRQLIIITLCCFVAAAWAAEPSAVRTAAQAMQQDGNWADAYQAYRSLVLKAEPVSALEIEQDFLSAVECLRQLGREAEADPFIAEALAQRSEHWAVWRGAAQALRQLSHWGSLVGGAFSRGEHANRGQVVSSRDRDRVRAIQYLLKSAELAAEQATSQERGDIWMKLAQVMRWDRQAWEFQIHTKLNELPPYDAANPWGYGGSAQGAPVTADGQPVVYETPRAWGSAVNDGERWRWCLHRAGELDEALVPWTIRQRINFADSQFGVQTLRQVGWWRPTFGDGHDDASKAGFEVHTLSDHECLARMANGVQRFELPPTQHPVALTKLLFSYESEMQWAHQRLAQIYENRRQYTKAVVHWTAGNSMHHVQQITGNWGRIDALETKPAGDATTFSFTYRNADRVTFTAHRIDIDQLLQDIAAHIAAKPGEFDHTLLQFERIGYNIIHDNRTKYRGAQIAQWEVKLNPDDRHWDKQQAVTTPFTEAGAYLITAQVVDGNATHAVLWLADSVLMHKQLDKAHWYQFADARDGQPVADANLEFIGFTHHWENRKRTIIPKNQRFEANEQGTVVIPHDKLENAQWMTIARAGERLAVMGFRGLWTGSRSHDSYQQTQAFVITDRPVYRPGDTVYFSGWLRHAAYDLSDPEKAALGNTSVQLRMRDGKGDELLKHSLKTDVYGGIQYEWTIPEDASLGAYSVWLHRYGGQLQFRVEEYKKPEFEVKVDAPTKPIALGDEFTATIRADYLFGAPVTEAEVHYKVTRTTRSRGWFPARAWDWLYGRGWWWVWPEATWYPGWDSWGCVAPLPPWWPHGNNQPEVVAEATVPISKDGTVTVTIDSAAAKLAFGNRDHEYAITAEVVDTSRRTVVGSGSVIAARQPLNITLWSERGFVHGGDVLPIHVAVAYPDGSSASGLDGTLQLDHLAYDAQRQPKTTELATVSLTTAADGTISHRFQPLEPGQYRVTFTIESEGRDPVFAGTVVTVLPGDPSQQVDARFGALEIIPDRSQYGAGESARIMIACDRADATVWWFVRCQDGHYPTPQRLQLNGHTTIVEMPLSLADMPNIFVEAVTIANGEVHTVSKNIVLPPLDRALNITATANAQEVGPGDEVTVDLTVTAADGQPVTGPLVVTAYDRAIEYISGGSNVTSIVEAFWNWKRHHHPRTQHTLGRVSRVIWPKNGSTMQNLGAFGHLVYGTDQVRNRVDGAARMEGRGMVMSEPAVPGLAMAMDAAAAPMESRKQVAGDQEGEAASAPVMVRSEFADSAFWDARVITDGEGKAQITMTMPDDLTTWQIKVWGVGPLTEVGEATTSVVTTKNVLVRLQAPRFFVERDEVVLSANVHNEFDQAIQAAVNIDLTGGCLEALDNEGQSVAVPAHGQTRVDWRVKVVRDGEAVIRVTATSADESDAMEKRFPVKIHGAERTESWSLALRPGTELETFMLTIPEERRVDDTTLSIQVSPSIAASLVEALPFLASYPHGCTEQTLNRFVPTVVVQQILLDMDIDLAAVRHARVDPQELVDGKHEDWRTWKHNPVFDADEVADMVRHGAKRLAEMQCRDGGWGWFSGHGERSYPHTTAVVVRGLMQAQAAGPDVIPGLIDQGLTWLAAHQAQRVAEIGEDREHRRAWVEDALVYTVLTEGRRLLDGQAEAMGRYLFEDRKELPVYAKAMLALAEHRRDNDERFAMYLRNVEQFVQHDAENQTAWVDVNRRYWWYWYGSAIEANAWYLKLLNKTDPRGETAASVAKYLLTNRKHAAYWDSTRDTALAIEALAEFWKASGEADVVAGVEILVGGEVIGAVDFTPDNLFTVDASFEIGPDALPSGEHEVMVRRVGDGPLYANAWLTTFPTGDTIEAAGLDLKIKRTVYRLVGNDREQREVGAHGQAVVGSGQGYKREPLADAPVRSGDLLEVELVIETKNDFEYLMFNDPRAAGCEPIDVRSGYTGNGLGAYMEVRDDRTAFFVRQLPHGRHSVSYRLRAEIPGDFAALPATGEAMYAPELIGNSALRRIRIDD